MTAILDIEKALLTEIDGTNGEEVAYHLNQRNGMLHMTGKMVETATQIYEEAKGEVSEIILENEKILNAKQSIQNQFIAGKLAEYAALYCRAERTWKMLDKNIAALISILSYEKEMIKTGLNEV